MTFQPTFSEPEIDHQATPQAEHAQRDTDYYRRVLHDLIDMGADIARMVHQNAKGQIAKAQAEAAPDAAPASDPTIAFDRISRAIRRTITLARHLDDPIPARAVVSPAKNRVAARKCILRSVEDTIEREAGYAEAEALNAELLDRMDAPDLEDDLAHRPIGDIIADIIADLGLSAVAGYNPHKRRSPADIAALCAYAALPPARASHQATAQPVGAPPCTSVGSGPPSDPDADGVVRLHDANRFRT